MAAAFFCSMGGCGGEVQLYLVSERLNTLFYFCQVCHHEDCQEINNGNPLLLCLKCDEVHHLGAASNHARFDVPGKLALHSGFLTLCSSAFSQKLLNSNCI